MGEVKRLRILSFGGGVQTSAVCVLLARGEIPPVDAVIFADTGGETPETYAHIEVLRGYLAGHGMTLDTVTNDERSLEQHIIDGGYATIPLHSVGSIAPRQCTNQFKVRPIKRRARELGATALTMLLGISADEVHRMKPDREKWVTRVYPLVDLRLTRAACRQLVIDAGLPDPPRSSCFFCPFNRRQRWQRLAVEHPEHFDRAVAIEAAVNKQTPRPSFLSSACIPLARIPTVSEMMDLDGFDNECEGVCGV